MSKFVGRFAAILGIVGSLAIAAPLKAADMTYDQAIADIQATLGFVPDFFKQQPRAGFAGAWLQLKELEFGGDTALSAKDARMVCHSVAITDCSVAGVHGIDPSAPPPPLNEYG